MNGQLRIISVHRDCVPETFCTLIKLPATLVTLSGGQDPFPRYKLDIIKPSLIGIILDREIREVGKPRTTDWLIRQCDVLMAVRVIG